MEEFLILIAIILVQQILATIALIRLYKYKPKRLKTVAWNIIILAVFFVGPIAYLILEQPKGK